MNLRNRTELKVAYEQVDAFVYVSFPRCEMSRLACLLVEQDYLTDNQMKVMSLMGYDFVDQNQPNEQGE